MKLSEMLRCPRCGKVDGFIDRRQPQRIHLVCRWCCLIWDIVDEEIEQQKAEV